MDIKIALAGNPNSGKTTMFNDLTGSTQRVGNWPGVTVEKKEGRLRGEKNVIVQDLPGIYSLSPYTLEEVVARNYLLDEKPDAILNIVDGSNLERNLYLTTQLLELGIPIVVALNMIDVVRKTGDIINIDKLSAELGCPVVETSALKGENNLVAAREAVKLAQQAGSGKKAAEPPHVFDGEVEHSIAHIEDVVRHVADGPQLRWYSIKLFERDEKVADKLRLSAEMRQKIEEIITACEASLEDDAESVITNERYSYISRLMDVSLKKARQKGNLSTSDKIDRIVTNRWLALPIFAVVMFVVYYVSVTTVGDLLTSFTNDVLFGEWIIEPLAGLFAATSVWPWLASLIVDGIVGGVGAVLGFVPQMLVLFFFLSVLEDIGYMARVAFIMDRIFRKFGLSGKSFIPMLIGSGCSVPGIMASRTIENERDRRMTIMTTSFIPCGAKVPIVGLLAGAIFGRAWWVAPSAYFVGIAAVIISGIILKKTKMFAGEPAPFVMELPAYHAPGPINVLRSMWERGWSFIKRAGTVILLASIVIWFLSGFGFVADPAGANHFIYMDDDTVEAVNPQFFEELTTGLEEDEEVNYMDHSVLASIGRPVSVIFRPLGFGLDGEGQPFWQASVATVMGLVAKEEVVGVFGVLFGVAGDALELVEEGDFESLGVVAAQFGSTAAAAQVAAYAFMVFNLLCAPCFAAIGAISREMNNRKWTAFAIAYLCVFAYICALIFYQFAALFLGAAFGPGTVVALLLLGLLVFLLARPGHDKKRLSPKKTPSYE